MIDERDDNANATITLEVPADSATKLDASKRQFGDKPVADHLPKTNAAVEGRLALRGARLNKDRK